MGKDPEKARDGVVPAEAVEALAKAIAEEPWGCDSCVFFDPTGHNSQKVAIGPCRRFPGDKPTVSADEWCGEFKKAK